MEQPGNARPEPGDGISDGVPGAEHAAGVIHEHHWWAAIGIGEREARDHIERMVVQHDDVGGSGER